MATYPSGVKSFTTKSNGGTIDAAHVNDIQDEVTAIEQDLITGVPVGRGGTGNTTLTANRVLLGNGSSAIAVAGAGTSGQVLTSNGASAPTFQDAVAVRFAATGRLTLESGVAVSSSDQTAKTTLYYTPYAGNQIGLYDGASAWVIRSFSELSIAVPSTSDTMYDVFVYDNAGTATLELTAWTNVTTRATALTTQDGILVKTGATTRRYVGSFVTTGVSGQAADALHFRGVWNYYNRVPRALKRVDTTNSWTYTTATFQNANASTSNVVGVVVGVAEVTADLYMQHMGANAGTVNLWAAIGYDSATVPIAVSQGSVNLSNVPVQLSTRIAHNPAVGYHYYSWLERSTASGTTTWYGDNNDATLVQTGLFGVMAG